MGKQTICAFVLAVSLLSAGAGCSLFNPFVEPKVPRPGALRDDRARLQLDGQNRVIPLHVTTAEAREYARLLQDAYRAKMVEMSGVRTAANATLIGTAASALGVAATGGATAAIAALGLSGAGVAAIGQQVVVSVRRTIYMEGALALECVIAAANAHEGSSPGIAAIAAAQPAVIDAIARLSASIANGEAVLRRDGRQCPVEAHQLDIVLTHARARGNQADALVQAATHAMDAMDPFGQILLSAVENVRLRVDQEIARAEPDLLAFDQALRNQLQSAAAQYGMPTPAPAPVVPQPTNPPQFKTRQEVGRQLDPGCAAADDAVRSVEATTRDLTTTMQLLGQAIDTAARTRPTVPANLFSNCSLNRPIGTGPLRVEPASAEIQPDSQAILLAQVRGGRQPYATATDVSPAGVDAKLQQATDQGQGLLVTVKKDLAKTTSPPLVVVVRDAEGHSATFVVRVAAAVSPQGANPPAAGTSSVAPVVGPAPVVPVVGDSSPSPTDIRSAQLKLADAATLEPTFDPGPANGVWNEQLRQAALRFLELNLEEPMPALDTLPPKELVRLVLATG